jgi:hypothetical protein
MHAVLRRWPGPVTLECTLTFFKSCPTMSHVGRRVLSRTRRWPQVMSRRWCRTWTIALLPAVGVLAACGGGSHVTYSAQDVQEALAGAGLRSHVVFDPQTSTTPTGALDSQSVEGPMFKLLASGSGDHHLVALVAGPQQTQPEGEGYETVAKVLDGSSAARRFFPQEGVVVSCFGMMDGRRGNVLVSAPRRYLMRVRAALGDLQPKLSAAAPLPLLRIKHRCVRK